MKLLRYFLGIKVEDSIGDGGQGVESLSTWVFFCQGGNLLAGTRCLSCKSLPFFLVGISRRWLPQELCSGLVSFNINSGCYRPIKLLYI